MASIFEQEETEITENDGTPLPLFSPVSKIVEF
jgi:hypothetical protein